ncbi:TPA: phage tail protein [Klebsiella pneumoniae]
MEVPNFKKSRLSQLVAHGLIISGRGGSKGGGSSRTPVEANDTVNSRAMASVLDLLGEGVIGGLIDGAKSIFLNDTPLQNSDNSYNFSGVTWWFRDGSQDQSVIDGFDFIETPKSVGRQLKQTSQVNVSLDSADSDRVRVVMKFPSLRSIDKKSGDTNGTTVQFKFQIDAGNGGGFVDVVAEGESNATISLTAKKTGVYYRSYVLDLPKPAKAYTLRAIRLTEDHTDNSYLYDDTYIDSIGEIVNTSLNYPNSALVGLKINSEQFGSSMPTRSYLIKGLKIRIPSNYNADTNSYDGNWDGTFKLASSSNPAWILFDLLTNTRYGLGQFVQESMINIGELYQIGRYCDAYVDDGFGGKEKRFSINTQITSRQDAYRVVQDIAGAFRGMVYWAGGMVHITQDSPADPVMLFSNSNVVNGSFAYKGSARKDRYSVALITYNNKEDGYKQSVEYVEDQEAIKRYGIRKTESVAFGCTSRGQAHRVGLWTLYTSRMESDVITFAVGMDSVFLMPGDIVLIADKFRAGRRNSGRITGYTSNSIKLDAPVDLTSVGNHITFLSAEGKMVGRDILENGKNITTVTFKTALSSNETPVSDAVWVIAQPDLTPLQARVVSVAEGDDGTSFNITAIQNNPTKYEAIDSGAQLIPQNTTVLDPTFSKPSGLAITEGTYLSSPGNLSVSLTATWQGKSAQYYISWRRSDAGNVSNWKSERVTEEQFELRGVAENGQYDFQVYAVSVGGRKTDPISITYKVLGTMTAPDAPTGLTAVGDYRSIVLNWVNPASVDLDHIEVLASKTNDKSKAQLIAKVSGTTFSHNGLEDSVTWYYWVRAANKRGMLSALNSPLATVATTRDVLSFLQNKITESELGQDLIADINSKAVATEVDAAIDEAKSETKAQVDDARTEAANAVKSAKEALSTAIDKETKDRAQAIANETTARNKAIADEASIRATAISNEVTARTNAIAAEVEARTKAVADEATARAKAVSDEAIARASAITDSVAVEASNRAKAVSDATAALDAKISKEARDRASAVSALDIKTANAINTETLNRISSIEDEARARADALLQEKNNRQSEISNLSTQVQTVNESLAQQISQIAAGTGEQFDSLKIWYFDTNSEGWTEDDGGTVPMSVTDDGWLKSSNSTASCRSPNNMVIDANAYRFLKLRIKKVGKPTWSGKLYWIGASEQSWSESRSLVIDEPEYDANGVATLTIHDIDWRASTTIRRFRFDFLKNQSDTNNLLIDWVAVGRPTPGAGMAALQDEKSARVDADAAEAANRNALAVQMRGSYEGNDLSKVGSGLIFQEQLARVTADKAEAMARQSLETKVDDSVSNINKSLDTLNTQDKAMASDITGLKSSLKDKADASALQTLKTSVDQQGSSISTQGQSITKLQNDLSTTNANVSKKADQTALTALQGTVTQQGKDISSQSTSITDLNNSLKTTNDNVAKKADSSAVQTLQNTVTQQGKDISTATSDISSLKSGLATTDGNVAKKADASALQSLQNTVTQQGKDLTSVGSRTTALENSLKATNDNVATKADASSLSTLQNTVSQQGKDITSASDAITSLNNSVGAMTNMGDNLIQDANLEGDGSAFRTQQNSGTTGSIVAFGAYGENSAGARMLKVNATSPGLFANGKKPTPVNGSRKFRYIVRAKGVSGAMNMLLRRWNFNGNTEGAYEDKNNTLTTDWQTITWDTSFSPSTGADGQAFGIYCHPSNAEIWIDSFQVFDITDAVNNDATASALSDLSTKVTKQGDTVSSQGTSITKLQNDLTSTKTDVSKKADASALQTLQNTVTDQGKTLTSQGNAITALTGTVDTVKGDVAKKADATALNNLSTRVSNAEDKISSSSDAITSLNSSLNQQSKRGANILPDGTFESYSSGYNITNGRVIVTTDDSHGGNKCIRVTRPNDYNANATDNSDNHIFSGFQVRDNAVFYVECWVKLDAKSTTMDGAVQIAIGMSLQYQDNSWQWPALIKSAKDLSADSWTKVSGYLKSSKSGIKQAMARISIPNVSSVKAGNSFLIDDLIITDVTDAYNAQQTADATASAVSTLQTTVSKQGDSITSQGDSITTLNNGLATANKAIGTKADASALQTLQNAVNQQGKDVASNTSNITALSNQIVNGKQGTWSRRIYKCQLSSAAAEPTFSDIQGLSPVFMDEVADAAKLDFSGAGSYVVAHYKAMVRVAADTTISVSPGSRVFDDSGAVYVNGVRQAVAISGTATLGFVLSSGWNTVEFLVNQWTGNAYINLGFKLGDKVAELYSGLGVSSLSTAINSINSNVNKVGDQTSSNSAAITSLKNSLSDTDSAVVKKADASALQTLQNTVTQQGKDIASQSDSVTNLSNALSNVSIGGVNLIKNSGDMAGWSGKTNEIFRGNAVISATTKAGSSYRDLKEITLDAPVDNAEYVYSFFAKGGENGQSMTAYFYNPNSTTSGVSSQGVSDGSVDGRMSFTLTTEWVRYWVKWKQKPGTGSKRIILARIQASSTKDQTVSITSPKLEVGNMPTEWSPAPSDMASSNDLSSLKTTVDANSSSIQSVTSRVQKTEDNISTQNTAITKLQGDLSTTNNLVSTKADSAALQTLQNSVTQQGKDISSQGTRVTSIENSLTSGANLIPNAKMLNGAQGWGGSATTVDGYAAVNSAAGWQPQSATFEVTPGDTLDLSMMCLAGQAITVGWGLRFDGPSLSNATIYASNLSYQAGEKKAVSGTFVVPVGATTARLQPNTGATASLTVYNVVVTRRDAGTMANSSAIDSLTSTVQTQGDAISSVGGRTTSLENSLKTTNDNVSKKADSTTVQTLQNTVTQQGKDISAAGTNITSMQASLTRRTVFTVTAKGNGNSVTPGVFDESGKNLFTPSRSWALVTFAKQSDGSTVIATSKTYDVFGSANNGATMSADIEALASGTYVCVLTFDEPSGNRGKILSALESLGGTSEVVNSLPYRGAYILLGRKGMKPGDGLELRAPTGGDGTAHISTSVEFVNGVMMGLGAAGGVMMKADANASAITTLQNTVTQQGKDITSSSSAITSLQNGLVAANSNIDKKADATALQSLQNTVTQQGKDISTQSGNVTNLQNSLSATNTGLANLVADSDASKKIIGNLLTNSSFERGLEGFSGGASFVKVIDAQSPNSGSKILSCGAGTGTVSQSIAVTKDRTYKIGVFARCQSGSVVDNQGNNKLRIGNSSLLADFMFKPTDLPTGSTWKEISGTWKATVSGSVDVSINSSLKSGNQYFDDFYFIDITDIVNIDAASNAVASLTSRVTSAEGTVSSHTGSITNLSNSLNSLNKTVSSKADASALQSLQNTVTQQGKDLSSASGSVTDLKSSLNTLKVQTNPWIDGTFETYDNNQQLGGSTAIVTTDFKSSGSKCLKVTRPANTSGNSDKTIGSYSVVRQSAKYRVEFWAMMPAAEAPPSGWSVAVGLHSINKDGGNDWQGITFNEGSLGGRDKWVKFTGVISLSASVTRSHVWISTRGQSGSNTPGYAVYIDDVVITDITDAADAQATADANATAISSLQTKVSDIDGKVTAQTSQLSSMQSKVDASSSKVDQLSKTISDSQSTQASLNTSLQSQIDAQASANIKNQADLNSATTSIASIKSTQATQATQISAMAKTQTDMTASLNSQSASIQTLQEAVSNNDALNSTWMVKMQTNNNGQKYAAGIALGVDGKNMQSQFLVQADRFALINTSNGNTTTPFVIDNGVTYMNAAYIKDGSIGSAKVGDLMSSGFQENVRGWRISRDGTMNINGSGPGSSRTVITNGRIEVYDSNNRLRVRMGIF